MIGRQPASDPLPAAPGATAPYEKHAARTEDMHVEQPLLFTPGPANTSATVKRAMQLDVGSRDREFIEIVRRVRQDLVAMVGEDARDYEAVLMQGSGTFGIESVVGSAVPADGRLLVVANGAYGLRLTSMARTIGVPHVLLAQPEDRPVSSAVVRRALVERPDVTHVAVVHCETTTGVLNDITELGEIVAGSGRQFLVDAMSSFGGIPTDFARARADFVVSSSNKCLQGVPGFSFVLARRNALEDLQGRARGFSLDLHAQWRALEADGQFRFTPPTHAIVAFEQALRELAAEGGVRGRYVRYCDNQRTLTLGMATLGFEPYLAPEHQSPIITTFRYPRDPRFDFRDFYGRLAARGLVIYPGKLTQADCFRIGSIGDLTAADMRALVEAIEHVLAEMRVVVPVNALAPR